VRLSLKQSCCPHGSFHPGYVFVSVLYPKNDDLDNVERLGLSSGLSIAIAPVVGILLNLPYGKN